MHKFLLIATALVFPTLTLAAYNDVTLTTFAVLSVGGYTLNITGTAAVVQSIVVNPTTFTVTLSSGSSIQISSPTYNQLSVNVGTFTQSNSCAANTSVLTLSSAGPSGSVTVTPLSTICSTAASTATVTGGNGPIVGNASGTLQTPAAYYASLKANVASSTAPSTASTPPSLPNISNSIPTFTRTLKRGDTGSDVQALQLYLISKASGPGASLLKQHGATKYFGALTLAALKEFQKKVGIVPASGLLGPITQAYLNSRSQ